MIGGGGLDVSQSWQRPNKPRLIGLKEQLSQLEYNRLQTSLHTPECSTNMEFCCEIQPDKFDGSRPFGKINFRIGLPRGWDGNR
jgi:hypothetical protein